MMVVECEQGSQEWLLARCGKVGASRVCDIIAKTKSGPSTSRANYMAELIAERLTGTPADKFRSGPMEWGNENEPEARALYEFRSEAEIAQVGLVLHPTIEHSHASPDGLVGDEGLLEIKCPLTSTHIDTLLGQKVPGKYVTQMQWQMSCTGRRWCDFVSFDPRMPASMRLFVQRVHRDDECIATLEREVSAFLAELDNKVCALRTRYEPEMVLAQVAAE